VFKKLFKNAFSYHKIHCLIFNFHRFAAQCCTCLSSTNMNNFFYLYQNFFSVLSEEILVVSTRISAYFL